MSNKKKSLKWEWPVGRQTETKILVNVQKISKASKGFLGIGASPSLADSLPDVTDVVVSVISGSEEYPLGQKISLRIPGLEAKKLKIGEYAAFGLVGNSTICICVADVPMKTPDEAKIWLNKWACQ